MIEWDKLHSDRAVVLEMDPKKYPEARVEVWDRKVKSKNVKQD